jgi:hypothetical protein
MGDAFTVRTSRHRRASLTAIRRKHYRTLLTTRRLVTSDKLKTFDEDFCQYHLSSKYKHIRAAEADKQSHSDQNSGQASQSRSRNVSQILAPE